MKVNFDKKSAPCPICASDDSTIVLSKERNNLKANTVVCDTCGFTFINPQPSDKWISEFYSKNYRKYYFSLPHPTKKLFSRHLLESSSRLQFLKNFSVFPKSVLDIGSGTGAFAFLLSLQHNVKVQAIEPTLSYASFIENSLKVPVSRKFYDDFKSKEKYDLISTFHVLEHIKDINGFVKKCWNDLNDNGHLFIEVPNLLGKWKNRSFFHVAHLSYFSPNSLTALCINNGFSVIAVEESTFYGMPVIRILVKKSKKVTDKRVGDKPQKVIQMIKSRTKDSVTLMNSKRVTMLAFQKLKNKYSKQFTFK